MTKNTLLTLSLTTLTLLAVVGAFYLLRSDIKTLSSDLETLQERSDQIQIQTEYSVDEAVNKEGVQAVFLSNKQVYFGRLSDGEPGQLKLENIYYLQTSGEEVETVEDLADLGPETSLVKLGDELHGPEDVMHITRDQVLFWENLKDDSDVVKAIKDYEAQQ